MEEPCKKIEEKNIIVLLESWLRSLRSNLLTSPNKTWVEMMLSDKINLMWGRDSCSRSRNHQRQHPGSSVRQGGGQPPQFPNNHQHFTSSRRSVDWRTKIEGWERICRREWDRNKMWRVIWKTSYRSSQQKLITIRIWSAIKIGQKQWDMAKLMSWCCRVTVWLRMETDWCATKIRINRTLR